MSSPDPMILYYFDGRGRAELIRWILHAAGQDFKDERIDEKTWEKDPKTKEKTPFGKLPYVEFYNKKLGESHTIARYFAKQYGFAGKDAWEEAEVDALVDYTEGIFEGWIKWLHAKMEKDPKEEEIRKKYLTSDIVPYLKKYEAILGQSKSGFLVGQGPTWADFKVVDFLDEVEYMNKSGGLVHKLLNQVVEMDKPILDSHPLLKDYVDRVHNLKGIKEWLAVRRETEF